MHDTASSAPAQLLVLRAEDHRRMPWKNGGGETTEIAVFPLGSDLATFGWRISMATVASDGPFSIFDGIDRTLSIVEGEGMALVIGEQPAVVLTQKSEPLAFAADARTTATLISGGIVDLNVMTRRGAWTHRVERRLIEGQHRLDVEGGVTMLLALGNLRLEASGKAVELRRYDCAILDGEILITSDMPVQTYLIRLMQA